MVRLIDADALLKRMQNDPLFDLVERYGVSGVINTEPTVDAIPIEWIEKYTEENRLYQSDDFDLYIHDMIADWAERKEE